MKKLITRVFLTNLLAILFSSFHVSGQAGTAILYEFKNIVQINSSKFQYDLFITNTGSTNVSLRGYSWGLNMTSGVTNGGTITHTFVSRDPILSTLPSVSLVFTASSNHLRGTTTNATSGNEVSLPAGVPIRLGTFQVLNTVPYVTGMNPFLPPSPNAAIQNSQLAGRTACVATCLITPPGSSFTINGPTNTASGTNLNVLTANMLPDPLGANPFLLGNCPPTCTSVITNTNVTACDSYTWSAPSGNGQTYTVSGTYFKATQQGTCPCYDTSYLHLTINSSTSSSSSVTSCGSYTWPVNGIVYTNSAVYTHQSTNSSGCAQHDTLYLTITPIVGTQTNVTACNSYTWASNATTYTSSGTYYNIGACGTDTLNLTVNQSSSSSSSVTACNSYTWPLTSVTYTTSGNYTFSSINAVGCTQTDTLHLTVNHDSTHTTNLTTINSSYYWGITANTYTASGVYTATMYTAAGCTLTEILNLTLNNAGASNALMTFTNFVQLTLNSFTYDVMLTNTSAAAMALRGYSFGLNTAVGIGNGGTITHSFVTRDPILSTLPSVSAGTVLQSGLCATSYHIRATTVNATPGNEVNLPSGTPILIARMKIQTSAPFFTNGFNPFSLCGSIPAIQNLITSGKTQCIVTCILTPPGTSYTITGPSNTVSATNLNTLAVLMTPDPTSANPFLLYGPVSTCTSDLLSSITMDACDSYTWNQTGLTYTTSGVYNRFITDGSCTDTVRLILNILHSTTSMESDTAMNSFFWNTSSTTYTASGIYTFTSMNSQGCTLTSTLNLVIINGGCSIPFSVIEDQPISCYGNNDAALQASTTAAGTYTYTVISPTTGTSSNLTGYFNHLTPGTHTVFISDGINTCAQTITFIEPDPLDISFITDSLVSCHGNDGQLSVSITGGTNILQGYLTWWTNAAGDTLNDVLTNNFALNLSDLPAGNYNVAIEDDHGCFYNETGTIQVASPITVTATYDPIICRDGMTFINPSSTGGVNYSPIIYLVNGNPLTTLYSAGTYTITAIDAKGCSATTVISISNPNAITNSSSVIACNSYNWNGTTYTASGTYTSTFMAANGCDSIHTLAITLNNGVSLAMKALLSGAYAGNGLMYDSLRVKNVLPMTEPYTSLNFTPIGCSGYNGGEVMNASLLTTTGANAIVDWVHIEIRNTDASYSKVATKNALIQRDGDIVDMNGNALSFACVCPGNYFVTIKHRNHLGVMTANSVALSSSTQLVDFTTNAPVWTKPGVLSPARESNGSIRLLWPGDTRTDKNTKYNGLYNDKEPILIAIGVATPNNILQPVYRTEDANMDAKVKYNNTDNDKNFILNKIISSSPTSGPNDVLIQHTPN